MLDLMYLFLLLFSVIVINFLKSENLLFEKNNLYLSLTKEVWDKSFGKLLFSLDQAEGLVMFYPRSQSQEGKRERINFLYVLLLFTFPICLPSVSLSVWLIHPMVILIVPLKVPMHVTPLCNYYLLSFFWIHASTHFCNNYVIHWDL